MKIPKTINIFGKTATITSKKLDEVHGLFEPTKFQITLAKSMTKHDQAQTLLHECFHAVMFRCGINQSLNHELEEIIVDILATFMVDNFELKVKNGGRPKKARPKSNGTPPSKIASQGTKTKKITQKS